MNVLVLCDDRWHPAKIVRQGLDYLPQHGFSLDWVENAAGWNPAVLVSYPVVILSKSNNNSSSDETPWMEDPVQAAFAQYVRRGGGLLAIHSGTAGYASAPLLR